MFDLIAMRNRKFWEVKFIYCYEKVIAKRKKKEYLFESEKKVKIVFNHGYVFICNYFDEKTSYFRIIARIYFDEKTSYFRIYGMIWFMI